MTEKVKTQKCNEHPQVDAIHINLATNAALCVTCALAIRRDEAEAARHGALKEARSVVSKLYNKETVLSEGHHAAKVCYQVLAGLVPGSAMPEFTEEWWITGGQWDAINSNPEMTTDHPDNLFMRAQAESYWYAERLTDPRVVNWVRVDFIYF
ncbi:MAG: hypothetical protein WCB68_21615 [Pyrinomonadaceae bacterium]